MTEADTSVTGLKPTFIGGHRKSGTTMFLALFDGHPEVCAFPVDSGFFYAFFPTYLENGKTHQERVNRISDFMFRQNFEKQIRKHSFESEKVPPVESMVKTFKKMAEPGDSYKQFLEHMIAAYRAHMTLPTGDHSRWLEKTTSTEIYAPDVFDWYPDAKFLHLIRDPRDNYASLKSGWEQKYSDRGEHPWELIQSMLERCLPGLKLAGVNRRAYGPEQYRVLRYEDLVRRPRELLEGVCRFLEIPFDEALYTPTVFGLPWKGNNFEGKTFDGISDASVGRWTERIDEEEAKILEFYFRGPMRTWDYEFSFSPGECRRAVRDYYRWRNYNRDHDV